MNNKVYLDENPLFFGEYHQAFKNSNLLIDFGYTQGYKKTSSKKVLGKNPTFFSIYWNHLKENDSDNNISLSFQEVSNDKYLKLYKIKSI